MIRKSVLIGLLSIFFVLHTTAQNKLNELIISLTKTDNKTEKVDILLQISDNYRYAYQIDSAIYYALEAEMLSKELENNRLIAKAIDVKGKCLRKKGLNQKSVDAHLEAYLIALEIDDKKLLANIANNVGVAYRRMDQNDKALEFHLIAYKVSEEIEDLRNLAKATNSIGIIYSIQGLTLQSTEYFKKALEIEKIRENKTGVAINLAAIGWNYEIEEDYEKALKYYYLSLEVNKEANNARGISIMQTDIGKIFRKKGEFIKALEHYDQAIASIEKIGDKRHITQNLLNKGEVLIDLKRYDAALNILERALNLGKKQLSLSYQFDALWQISQIFELTGNTSKALAYYKQANMFKDSLFAMDSNDKLMEIQTRFETEQKEKENVILKKNYEIQSQKFRNQKIINISTAIVLLSVIIIAFMLFVGRKRIKSANMLLSEKNTEIIQQNEEILTQSESLHEANQKVVKQHAKVKLINKQITDNINYAKRIQTAALPYSSLEKDFKFEHFILFKPRDIVSGDFFWFQKTNENLIFAAADCTGHGVSGAFLSMLGISFLNEIVRRKEIERVDQVLNELRDRVKITLGQTGEIGGTKDGMDISLCSINIKTMKLQFAGANNPLYLFRNKELIELNADRQPIGVFYKEKSFTNHEIQLKKDDVLYLFSDGFADQFGENTERKFLRSNLRKLFHEIYPSPMPEQKQILKDIFDSWKGNLPQTDDVLIMGVRI